MIQYGAIVPVDYLPLVQGRPFHLVLAHMIKQNEQYREFYKSEAQNDATIVIDNSSYELGDAWATPEELIEIYKSLESPDVYLMCPEVAFNAEKTSRAVEEFASTVPSNVRLFGTVHGMAYDEVAACYKRVEAAVDYVGFSYRIWCSDLYVPYSNKTTEKSLIRLSLLRKLAEDGIINKDLPHHLLGITDPLEIVSQVLHPWIKSCDSSTAYVHAKNDILFSERGFEGKERLVEKINFNDDWNILTGVNVKHNILQLDAFGKEFNRV